MPNARLCLKTGGSSPIEVHFQPLAGNEVLNQYSSVKPKNLGKDAKFRVSTGLKLVPKILN
ncbi:hypothetical protein LC613_28240 [Nostoc sphaeroides CHAB 2801]|uniref:hypothetical protein n=1 Tax=Nostoc sphaeroides TaxID=446679 RepID=UPI000E54F8F6|nr:hypothetical protein [Nostoc sphaeroides]MCC5631623.1 hypothetical protein [Nostoc sphaeroides CHAB 2801]